MSLARQAITDPLQPMLAEVRDVDFAYGQLQVLFGVSLQVAPGEALAVLGTNGAGKSTLLKVLSGLENAARGSVHFDGREVTEVGAEELTRRGLVVISGGRSTFPDLTVAESLQMQAFTVRRRKAELAARREQALELFPKLRQLLNKQAGTLSGGEQQQLALAKAVLLEPKLLCIDELSLGLAPIVVQDLLAMVRRIHASGTAVLLVEQSLNIAAQLCERAIFLEKGSVKFEGKTQTLLENDDIARAVFLGRA
jgi:ABC-type branched-subunit amino acid transport system ATPase component